jgi:hypothetical protein
MEVVVAGVLLPVRRFAATGDDNAMPEPLSAFRQWNGGCQVHEQGDWANDAVRVMHQSNQVTQPGLSPQIENALEWRVIVSFLANLDEQQPVAEGINDLLPAAAVPPFDSVIIFAAGGDDPIRALLAQHLFDGTAISFFPLAEVNVAFEFRGAYFDSELLVEEFNESVEEVIGSGVAPVN